MKKTLILATFTGADGSCGYSKGKEYPLTITMYKGNIVAVHSELLPTYQRAEYGSVFAMLENWSDVKVQSHGTEADRELTFGEKAVGITFNPGGSPAVNKIKRMNADLIDNYNDARTAAGQGEKGRMFSTAITHTQEGQMWGVKADTWQY